MSSSVTMGRFSMGSDLLRLINDIWVDRADPEMVEKPLLSSPFYYLGIIAWLMLFIRFIGPRIVASNPKKFDVDYRPFMLIYNGFLFGTYGVGIMLGFVVSNFGRDMMTCGLDHLEYNIRYKFLKIVAYIFLFFSFFNNFGKATFNVFRRKHQVSNLKLIHYAMWTMTTFSAAVFRPVGPHTFVGLMIGLHSVFYYGYLVMTVASSEMRPKGMFRWKIITKIVHILTTLASGLHHTYFYSLYGDNSCGQRQVLLFTGTYNLMVAFALFLSLIRTISIARQIRINNNNNNISQKDAKILSSPNVRRQAAPTRVGG